MPGAVLTLIDSVPSTQTWYYDNTLTQLLDTGRHYMVGYRLASACVSTSRSSTRVCNSNSSGHERFVPNGISEFRMQDAAFRIVPNPNNGRFKLITNYELGIKNLQLKINDILGNEVYRAPFNTIKNNEIDLSYLSNGVYFISLFNDEFSKQQKVVVVK